MASPDPVQHRPKVHMDWSPDFSFARRPRDPPRSPGVPSPRTAPPLPDAVKEEPRPAGQAVLPSPLSPVRGRERRRPGCLVVDVPRASRPLPLRLPTPEAAASPSRDGARSLLLFGLPESEAARLGRSLDRRESAPVAESPASASTIHSEILQLREHLRSLGPVYLGNTSAADVLVQAVSLRRNSLPDSPSAGSPAVKEEPLDEDTPMDDATPDDAKPRTPESPRFGNEISVRARVRPRQPDRRPFVMRRKFNLDELRATIPDPGVSPARRSSVADMASPYPCTPGPPPTPLIGRARRRSTSAKHGPMPFSPRGRRTPGSAGAGSEANPAPRPANLMPIRESPAP